MFAHFRSTLRHHFPINRIVRFNSIESFTFYLILVLGILLVPGIGNTCTKNTQLKEKERLAKELFGGAKGGISFDHNSYRCNFKGSRYKGDHPGWDADFTTNNNQKFYSLTEGIVIMAGKDSENTIAIYDPITRLATLYLHAEKVDPEVIKGEWVYYGQLLGWQGKTSYQRIGEHVHIEVRKLPPDISMIAPLKKVINEEITNNLKQPSHGTKDKKRPTIDPIPYLYRSVKSHTHIRHWTVAGAWAGEKAKR